MGGGVGGDMAGCVGGSRFERQTPLASCGGWDCNLPTHVLAQGPEWDCVCRQEGRAGISEELEKEPAWKLRAKLTKDRGPHCCPHLSSKAR